MVCHVSCVLMKKICEFKIAEAKRKSINEERVCAAASCIMYCICIQIYRKPFRRLSLICTRALHNKTSVHIFVCDERWPKTLDTHTHTIHITCIVRNPHKLKRKLYFFWKNKTKKKKCNNLDYKNVNAIVFNGREFFP